MEKRITLLGSTGSIGRQSLEVAQQQGYKITALCANRNISLLEKQVYQFKPFVVGVGDASLAKELEKNIAGMPSPPVVFSGPDAAKQCVEFGQADVVLNALVGIAGLSSTLAALQAGVDVALANKESLVAGGQLVLDAAEKTGAKLLPVDSEHSAIFQCLQDPYSKKSLKKIILTASGGPFYGKKQQDLQHIKPADALRHPNWDMGGKITIDSATLMNKGLELIEAMWLFALPEEKIEILIQRESIIHSLVEFADHSVLAQLGVPDMRIPIQYALTWPQRLAGTAPALDFKKLVSLSFGQPDIETFRCLAACRKAAAQGGLAPCAVNGANEQAVELFLQEKISFLQIGELVENTLENHSYKGSYTLQDVYECDRFAREYLRTKAGVSHK